MLTHSPQATLHKKIIYNFVWIYLSQHCTRELLVHCWPIWLTYNVYEENNLYKCCIDPSDNIAQENYLYIICPERTDMFSQENWL